MAEPGGGKRAGRAPRTQAERTALSDRRMLDAAVRLIAEHGTAKTTLKDIGEAAGYSRGLASYRFGSKAGLFRALSKHVSTLWVEQIDTDVDGKTGLDALLATVDVHRHFLRESPEPLRAMFILWFESIGPDAEFKGNVAHVQDVQRQNAARWIRAGIDDGSIDRTVDPERFAALYCSALYGIAYQWLVNPDGIALAPLHEELETSLRRLLEVPTATATGGSA